MNGQVHNHPSQFMVQTSVSAQTASYPPHTHCSKVDAKGNGATSMDLNHQHNVVNGVAQPTPDGHMHGVTNGMCPHDPKRSWGKAGCSGCMKR